MGLHVIITGNPVDGFEIYGPFATADEAAEFTMKNPIDADWWIAPLHSIEELQP
jgi:hypothetical protein